MTDNSENSEADTEKKNVVFGVFQRHITQLSAVAQGYREEERSERRVQTTEEREQRNTS